MLPIKTILHPTDFSAPSRAGYQLACALAHDYGAKLLLLHVRQITSPMFGEFGALPPPPEESEPALKRKLEELKPAVPITVERYMATGDAATEILRLARDSQVSMIVLGTHGRSGLSRLLMGSVAEQVMRKATCLVLTAKTPLPIEVTEPAAAEPALAPA